MRTRQVVFVLATALCCLPRAATADTTVGGTISTDTTWTVSGSPYIVASDVTISSGVSLTIEPGVAVKIDSNHWISIRGTLTAVGTTTEPIVITANSASPTPGYWRSLAFRPSTGSSSQMAYVTVEYGGRPAHSGQSYGAIIIDNSSPSLDHVNVMYSSASTRAGIYIHGQGAAPTISNSTIATSDGPGVWVRDSATPTITTSTITGNGGSGVFVQGGANPTIINSTSSGNDNAGVRVKGGATVTITGSEIASNSTAGVSVGASSEAIVEDTAITDNTDYAFKVWADGSLSGLTGLTVSGNGGGTKDVIGHQGGSLSGAAKWVSALEWHLVDDLTIAAGATLTIEPGVTVKIDSNHWISIRGTLTAVGTAAEPIVITANSDLPTPGYWRSLAFRPSTGSSSQMAYVTVEYGGRPAYSQQSYGAIIIDNSSPILDHVTVLYSSASTKAGIYIHGQEAVPMISNSTIANSDGPGVWVSDSAAPAITTSTITGSGGPGVRVQGRASPTIINSTIIENTSGGIVNTTPSNVVVARPNYWGTETGPSGAGFGDGQSVTDGVFFEPWLVDTPSVPLYVVSAAATQRTFNPAYQVYNRLDFTTSLDGEWSVTYSDVMANPVRAMTGTGTSGTVIWDGRDTAGTSLPPGTYTYALDVIHSAGHEATTARGFAILDEDITELEFSVEQLALEFNPGGGGTVEYVSTVPQALHETLVVKNESGETVRTLFDGPREFGEYIDTWDGRDEAGELVRDGPYFYIATATWSTNTMVWDLTAEYPDGEYDHIRNLNLQPFDPFNNKLLTFDYNFPLPGRVSIGALSVLYQGCTPFCIVHEEYQESGPHTFSWAGVDESGVLRDDIRYIGLASDRRSWSANAVMIFGSKPEVENVRVEPPLFAPMVEEQQVIFDFSSYQGEALDVTVEFLNQQSLSVLRTVEFLGEAPGHVAVSWDGRADNGMLVAPGAYTVTVTVQDPRGNQARGQILTRIQY